MAREVKVEEKTRDRVVLRIKCKTIEILISGIGNRSIDLFEGYAVSGLPAPLSIEDISRIERVKLKDNFYDVLEVIFEKSEAQASHKQGV